ncbi:MAG: hypothetical protein KF726_05345 [Anaerolineae bacterium]|nr:hypothetical protein [Anaerolineae bacterium]
MYETAEREQLTDGRQREVGHCFIGPDGIKWTSQPPLLIKFGQLTRVEFVPGQPAHLLIEWREQGQPNPAIAGIPVVSEIITLLRQVQFIGRLLEGSSITKLSLPIPKHYEAEAPALAERFQTLIRSSRDVTAKALLWSLAVVIFVLLIIIVYFLLWWWSARAA